MSVSRHLTSTSFRCKSSSGRKQEHSSTSSTKVMGERNQAVVPVEAWVEVEQGFLENPSALALLTEEIQAAKRRENEENLHRFQQEVRRRVAEHAHFTRKRHQNPEALNHYCQVWTDHVFAGETLVSAGSAAQHNLNDRNFQEPREAMRQVRLRLAACRLSPSEETESQLPGENWNTFSIRHKSASHMNNKDENQGGDDQPFTHHHECLLVKQKPPGHMLQDSKTHSKLVSDPSFQPCMSSPRVLWSPTDPEEELKKQHRSHFLMHRRLCMNVERRQVKENQQHRKHVKRTASIKAEKERFRLEEERRLKRDLQLAEERRRLQDRGQLELERLRQEEEERAAELQRRKQKEKIDARFIEALKAKLKERLSQGKMELPPLCLCASSFWDTHPETCANNCFFHNNPKAFAKALHSTLLSFGLQ